MKSFIDKFFSRSNNLDFISKNIKQLTHNTPVKKIFSAIDAHSHESKIMYVGGCVRKILNNEKVDDIDLATNLNPKQVCEILKKNNIKYYESGIRHGTITAVIDKFNFEITSLREDISTDGRHAEVRFSKDWKEDASRRDFTINSIYSDLEGNLFDPYNGKKDLEKGFVNFIGDPEKRIKEDYLRILRYIRFFINYSKQPHKLEIIRRLKVNLEGISKLSKDRLLDELKKMIKLDVLEKLSKDKLSLEIILIIFPELKNIKFFSKMTTYKKDILKKTDHIFLLILLIYDDKDNLDYFLYKFNISKKDQKRIKIIDNFYRDKLVFKNLNTNYLNRIFYYEGKQAVIDILNFKIVVSKKLDNSLITLCEIYRKKDTPIMPIAANKLMSEYHIPEGKQLGLKLKKIEQEWIKNNFQISNKQVADIIKN
tara:strand:- start:648 stop:1922 length:1275 start_codon:yes stop_codon:yes gene_type:complete